MKPAEEVIGAVGLSTMVVRAGDTCVAMGISDPSIQFIFGFQLD